MLQDKIKIMIRNLTKAFETSEYNSIEVRCNYDDNADMVVSIEVIGINHAHKVHTDFTELFKTIPQFVDLVDSIDWSEVYAEEMAEREVYDEK